MFKTWFQKLFGYGASSRGEPTPVIVRPVRARKRRVYAKAIQSCRVMRAEQEHTMPSGPRLEGSILEAPPESAVPSDLMLMTELAAAEREQEEQAELRAWLSAEDVRSERLRLEEEAVLVLLRVPIGSAFPKRSNGG